MILADLDTAPCGYLSFADTGTILEANNTLVTLLGFETAGQLIGKSVESIFTIATRIFYQTHFFPLLKLHGKAEEIFFTLKKADRQECPVICNAVRKLEKGDAANHCIFIEATQRSKYEQEMLKARQDAEKALSENRDLLTAKAELERHSFSLDRRLSELGRMNDDIIQFGRLISHDLQEPVRKIAVFTDRLTIENRDGFDQATVDRLHKINRECFQLRHLALNLERFLSLNVRTEKLHEVGLNGCVKKSFLLAHEGDPLTDVKFTVSNLPSIQGYASQLELLFSQIFANCLQNKDAVRPLEIRVECSRYQENVYRHIPDHYRYMDFVKVLVIDNGKGFAKADGESFFNIQRRMTKTSRELSFGLAFCKKVVENHFGDIAIEPLDSGGAMVSISLPLSPE